MAIGHDTTAGSSVAQRAKAARRSGRARFAEEDVVRTFGPTRSDRGRLLAGEGLVTTEEVLKAPQMRALVEDGHHRYRVTLEVTEGKDSSALAASCSCKSPNCAHGAATAFALLERFPALARPSQSTFIDRLVPPEAPAEQRRTIYGLEAAEGDDSLYVTVATEISDRNTRRIEGSSPKRAAANALTGGPGEADRTVCRLLGLSSLPLVAVSLDDEETVDDLLAALVETGRARWGINGPKLVRGPSKRFLLETNPRTGARKILNRPPKTRIFGSDPAWYVLETTGHIGSAMIDEVAAQSFGPATHSHQPSRGSGRAEPAPTVIDVVPVPVLTAAAGENGANDVLLLHFEYGDHLVREDDPAQFVRGDGDDDDDGEGPVFIRRDKRLEEAATAALRGLGLTAVRVTAAGLPSGGRGYAFRSRNPKESWQWLVLSGAEDLRRKGWKVELGETFPYRVIEIADDWDVDVVEAGNGWFSLDVGIEVEGRRVPLLPILIGIIERGGLASALAADGKVRAMLDDGRILALPAERVAKFLATLEEMISNGRVTKDGRLTMPSADVPTLVDLESIVGTRWHGGERLRDLGRRLRTVNVPERIEPPPSFRASLRPYQRDGLDWLQFLRANEMGGILADDMGLGKTAQTLAHIAVERAAGRLKKPCLIVVPTSLVPNWVAEAGRFTPDLSVLVFHGLDRHSRRSEVSKADLVVTTYAILARDVDFLAAIEFHIVVLDEAQAIKNPLAKSTRAACKLKARYRLCLSGTPIENHLGEVWSQFAFLMPGILSDHKTFTARFRTPIEKRGDEDKRKQLAKRLRPFVLRRTKAAVATDLPPKTNIVNRVELASDQRDLYETIRLSMHQKVREEIARIGLARSKILILDALLKLRQACCDPRLVKLDSARRVSGSGKLDLLVNMVTSMIEEGRRILLFSQFTSMLDLIKEALKPTGIQYVELRGSTADRATPVERFQACEVPLFLISLKAGGRGLNLTAADTVIHYDPWWNPAVENQATDRAHRIGQVKPVFVYKLIASGTVEERILELQERKGSLADAMLDEGSWTGSLTADDLDFLFDAPVA
ncbi:MAG: DEAD/DEAH box helicase [Rhodospirillaceae bacterium]